MAKTVFLQTANNFLTTVATGIDDNDLSLVVSSVTGAPAAYPYRLTIWNATVYGRSNPNLDPDMEIVEVSNAVGTTLTITRAKEDTSAAAHVAGSQVALLVTSGIIEQIQDAINALEPA